MDESLNDLRAYATDKVAEGFDTRAEIIESATEYIFGQHDSEVPPELVARTVDEELAAHYERQVGWETPTDCDRLDAAFANLERQGVVARQNFACCNTCGQAEIWDEVEAAQDRGEAIGYAFYHWQDTESARESGSLYVKFSGPSPEEVGELVVDALTNAGLDAGWNRDPDYAVQVVNITWRKRRANELPLSARD